MKTKATTISRDLRLVVAVIAVLTALPIACDAGGCGCPPLWTSFGSNCYRYFTFRNATWDNAEMYCREFTVPCTERGSEVVGVGHLVSIHSQPEMDFIITLYESLRNKRVDTKSWMWIGLHDLGTENTFVWSDGSNLDYTFWGVGQPNSYAGRNQDCIAINHSDSHGWNDLICGEQTMNLVEMFICKIPKW